MRESSAEEDPVPDEACDSELADAGLCRLAAGHQGDCDPNDERQGTAIMKEGHEQAGKWLDDFIHHR